MERHFAAVAGPAAAAATTASAAAMLHKTIPNGMSTFSRMINRCYHITSIYNLGRATNFKGFRRQRDAATRSDFSSPLFRVRIQGSGIFQLLKELMFLRTPTSFLLLLTDDDL